MTSDNKQQSTNGTQKYARVQSIRRKTMDIDILLTKDANLLRALQSSDTNEGDQDYIAPGTIFFVALAACFLWCW